MNIIISQAMASPPALTQCSFEWEMSIIEQQVLHTTNGMWSWKWPGIEYHIVLAMDSE